MTVGIRIAFTGAPGAGKTTTAEAIRSKSGTNVVDETAVRLLLKYKDEQNPVERMIREVKDIQVEDMTSECKQLEIFDRTLVDSLVYDDHFSNGVAVVSSRFSEERDRMRAKYSFSDHVFLFALSERKEDYKQTDSSGRVVRGQTYEEATELQPKFEKGYRSLGYRVHIIPWMEVHKRAHMVLSRIEEIVEAKLKMHSFPNFDLHLFAVGMNDEGGRIAECIHKTKQIWTNLSVALDRPFIDGVNFDELREIKSHNQYGIKEEAIESFNERQVNLAYTAVMSYYIRNAQKIAGKRADESVTVILHSFRGGDGLKQLELFGKILDMACPELKKKPLISEEGDLEAFRYELTENNVRLIFTYGKADRDFKKSVYTKFKKSSTFACADIILTFSVHVGLKPEWGSGTLVIPNKWTPIEVDQMEIQNGKMYEGGNHLISTINEIVKSPEAQLPWVQRINTLFDSRNAAKKGQNAVPLQIEDFKTGAFIELGGNIFIPESAKHRSFRIKDH